MSSSHLQPAARVIEICGGIEATAKLVGRNRSVVNRWLLPKERGGTGGLVPSWHQQTLLSAVPALTEGDFFVSAPIADKNPRKPEAA